MTPDKDIEAVKDVAVLKATGATNRFIGLGIAAQGVLVTLAAAETPARITARITASTRRSGQPCWRAASVSRSMAS